MSRNHRKHRGRDNVGDEAAEQEPERKMISPLRRLLMSLPLDDLLLFLHRTKLQYTLVRRPGGHYHAAIFMEGMLRYEASSRASARSAMCDAIAKFLRGEQGDYHELLRDGEEDIAAPRPAVVG